MLDSTTVELHLIDNSFCIGHYTVGVFTIETVNFLPEREFIEFIPIQDKELTSLETGDLKYTEVNVLKLPNKDIYKNERNNTDV